MLLLLASLAATAAPRADGLTRLDRPLVEAARRHAAGDLSPWLAGRPRLATGDWTTVVLELEGDPAEALAFLDERGIPVEAEAPGLLQVRVPYDLLPALQDAPGLRRAREPHRVSPPPPPAPAAPSPKGSRDPGETVSEGLDQIFDVEDWHAARIDGRRVRVAVLDVGFAGWQELEGVELPMRVRTSFRGGEDMSAHGTAVAEIIHDVAPRARLSLHQLRTDVEFFEALDDIAEEGVDVVNASIGFDNIWHADGTSPWSRAVDELVRDEGLVWVSAAGNENDKYRVGALSDEDEDGLVEIDGVEGTWVYAPDGDVSVSFRWSEDMESARHDIDLHIYTEHADTPCLRGEEEQAGDGSAPYEYAWGDCGVDWVWVVPVVDPADEVPLGELEGFLYGAWGLDVHEWSETRNLTLPADATRGLAIGACDGELGEAPYYTSRGPTDDGRTKPDLCAPSDVTTTAYGSLAFRGTSASTPHASGLAALFIDGERLDGDPGAVAELMFDRAMDLGDEGPDNVFGHGAIQAGPAPARCGCSAGPLGGGLAAALGGLIAAVRRRRSRSGPSGGAQHP